MTPPGVDDISGLDEEIGNADRLDEQAAQIAAQIEDDPLEVGAVAFLGVLDPVADAIRRVLIEAGNGEEKDAILFPAGYRPGTMSARTSVNSRGLEAANRSTRKVTGVPIRPRIFSESCCGSSSIVG